MASKYIPIEITIEILIQLPIKTLSRFKCVCKSWKKLIESPEFFKLHLKNSLKIDSYYGSLTLTIHRTLTMNGSPIITHTLYRAYLDLNDIKLRINKLMLSPSFETSLESIKIYQNIYKEDTKKLVFGKTRIVGSSNGLVLILSGENHIAICNPSIEQKNSSFKILPCLYSRESDINYRFYFRVFGLGYDSYSHCYKIVYLNARRALIYSLIKDNHSWREIALPDLEHNSHDLRTEVVQRKDTQKMLYIKPYNHSVFANNHLHWNITRYDLRDFKCSKEMILSLDLKSEVWGEVQVPDELDQGYLLQGYIVKPYIVEFRVLNGCLCLLISRGISYPNLQLWIMKEYGVKESWEKLCNVPNGSGIPMVYLIERNEYLLPGTQQGLGWYNPQERTIRKVEFHGSEFTGKHYYSTAVTMCTESFVDPLSIDGAGDGESSQEVD